MFFLRDRNFISEKVKSDSVTFLLHVLLGNFTKGSFEVRFVRWPAAEDVFPLLNMPNVA
jgi:hypothetical protein